MPSQLGSSRTTLPPSRRCGGPACGSAGSGCCCAPCNRTEACCQSTEHGRSSSRSDSARHIGKALGAEAARRATVIVMSVVMNRSDKSRCRERLSQTGAGSPPTVVSCQSITVAACGRLERGCRGLLCCKGGPGLVEVKRVIGSLPSLQPAWLRNRLYYSRAPSERGSAGGDRMHYRGHGRGGVALDAFHC